MSELPMVRGGQVTRDWAAIRGEIATYTAAAILIGCLVTSYKACEFLAGLIERQQNTTQELSMAISRLALIEEEEMARLERLEGREPRVVRYPLQNSLQKVP